MSKFINFLLMLFGLREAPKLATSKRSTAYIDDVNDTTMLLASSPTSLPVSVPTPATVAKPEMDQRFPWTKPVRQFQAESHSDDGTGLGYRGHSSEHFKIVATALRAGFTKAVKETLQLLDRAILDIQRAINDCGDMTPTHKANLQLELDYLNMERNQWKAQLTMPVDEPESEFAPSYEQFRVGYELGMQHYHADKAYSDANGMSTLIP